MILDRISWKLVVLYEIHIHNVFIEVHVAIYINI
jgi:hypothetical protein